MDQTVSFANILRTMLVRRASIQFTFTLRVFFIILSARTSYAAECGQTRPEWGTFRPQALISARAAVPHSPLLGFVYHPADSLQIRHLSTENLDKISSFSFSRHDGRTFADQAILDTDLNLHIDTHFQRHPSHNAWALRVAAKPIDRSKHSKPISMVFYAVSGPDDGGRNGSFTEEERRQWGSVNLDKDMSVGGQGIAEDVVLEGDAQSIGGKYRVVVKEPTIGTVQTLHVDNISSGEQLSASSGLGSRSLLRARVDKQVEGDPSLDAFHVGTIDGDERFAWAVEKSLTKLLKRSSKGPEIDRKKVYLLKDTAEVKGLGALVQRILEPPFQMEVVFVDKEGFDEKRVAEVEKDLVGSKLDKLLHGSRVAFDRKFERVFGLKAKGVSEGEIKFAKSALSNVLGGVGFFYGSSLAHRKSAGRKSGAKHESLPPVSLLTATPSRALFPRGFLWDEGFHQLIIQRWDPELSRRCMQSWMNAMQDSGWIPREQILGFEARGRFPEHIKHLLVQDPKVANPPTILMPLRFLSSISKMGEDISHPASGDCAPQSPGFAAEFTGHILDQVKKYYEWLKETQSGELDNSFRWRGRSSDVRSPDGYPLTLASGLDDYPRAEIPTSKERHVDLHSWMAWAAGVLAQICQDSGRESSGLWEEHLKLRKSLIDLHGSSNVDVQQREDLLLCDYDGDEKICHEGYVTILPLALGLLDPADARVGAILDALEDPLLLRSPAGVRSLSQQNRWHRRGDDYWTGSVWMPFNFLALAALKAKYAAEEGPYRERSENLFNDLRKAILGNAFRVFSETGQLWENYSPEDGSGKSGRHFTGWSALIVLVYAEMFSGLI